MHLAAANSGESERHYVNSKDGDNNLDNGSQGNGDPSASLTVWSVLHARPSVLDVGDLSSAPIRPRCTTGQASPATDDYADSSPRVEGTTRHDGIGRIVDPPLSYAINVGWAEADFDGRGDAADGIPVAVAFFTRGGRLTMPGNVLRGDHFQPSESLEEARTELLALMHMEEEDRCEATEALPFAAVDVDPDAWPKTKTAPRCRLTLDERWMSPGRARPEGRRERRVARLKTAGRPSGEGKRLEQVHERGGEIEKKKTNKGSRVDVGDGGGEGTRALSRRHAVSARRKSWGRRARECFGWGGRERRWRGSRSRGEEVGGGGT
ncbi:hypothetical protein CPLU01_15114 [Colletotrichum plurivorum]|uniref:Uncharacterized protein n=1 Tax=Colletotrichum plurivorum TaxID=2175906 RepID=A0A8H6MWA1_9PEZI|nr:hypothetical protein CPLU01_15114 [Colletotrichum plurivorum]